MMPSVDTVEWGSGRGRTPNGSAPGGPGGQPILGPVESAGRPSGMSRLGVQGRWVTPVLAGLGLMGLVAAELLPWVRLVPTANTNDTSFGSNLDVSSGGTAVGIDTMNTLSAFSYHLGLFATLAVAGAVQFGRLTQRRRLVGFAVGLVVAEGLSGVSVIHAFGQLASLGLTDQRTAATHTVIEPGAYLSMAGLLLLLASVLLSVAPERVRVRLADAVREPDDAEFIDEPIELTVSQVKPLDEAHWTRPDPHRR
jgi:hypothetical protein